MRHSHDASCDRSRQQLRLILMLPSTADMAAQQAPSLVEAGADVALEAGADVAHRAAALVVVAEGAGLRCPTWCLPPARSTRGLVLTSITLFRAVCAMLLWPQEVSGTGILTLHPWPILSCNMGKTKRCSSCVLFYSTV